MSRTTHRNVLRSNGGGASATPATMPLILKAQGDPTATGATAMTTSGGASAVLPSGAIPLTVSSLGGAAGGTNPTVDIGNGTDDDGFANELDADTVAIRPGTTDGALTGTALTADTTLYMMVGASAATSGTTTILVEYVMSDDGTS